ncbi:hypothetical protein PH242_22275 [Photorhabdus bodei]|nr:hypothetical protein [Photorhabdus bodei]MDB6370296.1 hypothetical protein [Photorhabdus bodei]
MSYTLWIPRCIAMARERIPGSIANFVINKYIYTQDTSKCMFEKRLCC